MSFLVISIDYDHKRNFVVKCEGDILVWNQYITKPKEKNVEGHGILYPNCLKKWGGRAVPWQGSPVPPVGGVPTIRRGPTMYIVLIS